jgi:hypothetical protein
LKSDPPSREVWEERCGHQPMSQTAVNWRRAMGAVVLGETVPVLLLVLLVAIRGPVDPSEADLFARRVGTWLGPIAGAATGLFVVSKAGKVLAGMLGGWSTARSRRRGSAA